MIVLGPDIFSKQLAEKLEVDNVMLEKRAFPDKELCPRILNEFSDNHVVFVNRMEIPVDPNAYFVESLFAIKTLNEMGVRHIDFVMPYMIFGRQDKAFRKGEPVSAKYILDALAHAGVSRIFTVSSYYERNKETLTANIPVFNINGFLTVVDYIKALDIQNPIIVDADFDVSGSGSFVSESLGADAIVFEKQMDFESDEIQTKGLIEAKDRNVVIINNLISSGTTIMRAIDICKNFGASSVSAFAVHGIFAGHSLERLKNATENLAVSDTIETPISEMSVVDLVANKMK